MTTNKTKKKRIFTKKDYNAGDGMITSVWGPPLWHYLHTMSFNYPVNPTSEEKKNYRNFILNLKYVLPCKYCRTNLKTNFKQLPIKMCDMKNRESFSKYVYNLHELVNKMLDKTSNLSYCDVRERYEHFRSRCTDDKPKIFKYKPYHYNYQSKTKKNKPKEKGVPSRYMEKNQNALLTLSLKRKKVLAFKLIKNVSKRANEKCVNA